MSLHKSTTLAFLVLGLLSAPANTPAALASDLPTGVYALAQPEETRDYSDLQPLGKLLRGVEIVALGENEHYTGGYVDSRFRVLRYLVEQHGYRTFLWESPITWSEKTRLYVEKCEGDPRDAMDALWSYVWWDSAVQNILTWLCEYNRQHPNDPVRFSGFDSQVSPIKAGTSLAGRLDAVTYVGAELKRTFGDRAIALLKPIETFCAIKIGGGNDNRSVSREMLAQCQSEIQRLISFLKSSQVEQRTIYVLEALSDHQESVFHWTRFYQTNNHADQVQGANARDRAMARLVRRMKTYYGDKKTVLWAHDYHIAANTDRWANLGFGYEGTTSGGTRLARALGRAYFPISFVAYSILMRPEYDLPEYPIPAVPQTRGTLEYDLSLLGSPTPLLLDLGRNGLYGNNSTQNVLGLRTRTVTRYRDHFRAVVYMKESRATDLRYPAPISK